MSKFDLNFDGMDKMMGALKKFDGLVKPTAEEALLKTHDHIQPLAHKAAAGHKRTGKMADSVDKVDRSVKWSADIGTIGTGFKIGEGGLPSIFLTYGTPRRYLKKGSPRANPPTKKGHPTGGVDADSKFSPFNVVKKNTNIQKKVEEIQQKVFQEAMDKAGI